MNFLIFLGEISFLVLIGFFLIFTLYNRREREEKAFRSSLIILLGLITVNVFFLIMPGILRNLLFLTVFLVTLAAFFIIYFSSTPRGNIEFIGEKKILVQTIPSYIKVRKLGLLTSEELIDKENKLDIEADEAKEKEEEEKLIDDEIRNQAIEKLKSEGKVFKHIK